ncbi:predicted protein [Nematostella vectensis]|uniref:SET domain-containing protein n=1 Tax=Nematostella vectensis TaxID=45351 RepID=A7S0T0_NEMVE|nr:predicted protein [Nematostella vectensis]|eukprot:XP_001634854.1 predicted protein [Nematostella vectensis]
MSQGKCFGPFRGEIIKKKRPPSEMHSLICDVGGVDGCTYHFYAHKDHQDQCKWLQQMQTAPNLEQQNIVAHNSAAGVSYEVARDIKQGEELLVLFNDSYGGKKYPAYIENMPVQFVPQPELLTVVPLEYKKQLGVTTSDKSPMQEASGETLSDGTCDCLTFARILDTSIALVQNLYLVQTLVEASDLSDDQLNLVAINSLLTSCLYSKQER